VIYEDEQRELRRLLLILRVYAMVAPAHAIRFWALEVRRFRPTERMKGNAEVITVDQMG